MLRLHMRINGLQATATMHTGPRVCQMLLGKISNINSQQNGLIRFSIS